MPLVALALLAGSCATSGSDGDAQPAGSALHADGVCRASVVVREGERCTHEYSYRSGTRITSSGPQPIVEDVSIVFRVDSDGIGHYGDLSGTSIEHTRDLDGETVRFVAHARGDGSFYIEEADVPDTAAGAGGAPVCAIGMALGAGERCLLPGSGGLSAITS